MSDPPLNIAYWASLYPVYTDYADEYEQAMDATRLVDRAERFWDWKGLNRSIPFETIAPVLKQLDRDDYITLEPQEAIETLSDYLLEEEVVESSSVVTSAFLLHLMASGPDQYSVSFPIYDRRVWNAYIYLWRIRGKGQQLYRQASQSSAQYAEFCHRFKQTCPDGTAREYERALFMFGGFVMKIPPKDAPTPIERIDEVIKHQEEALLRMQNTRNSSLIDRSKILNSGQ